MEEADREDVERRGAVCGLALFVEDVEEVALERVRREDGSGYCCEVMLYAGDMLGEPR